MYREDILERLRIDPGKRTLGELLQDRESAAHEIIELRRRIEKLGAVRDQPKVQQTSSKTGESLPALKPGMLIRLADLSEMLGVSRSTIYRWVSEGMFPAPVKVSDRAVRWRAEDVENWKSALNSKSPR
jgi:prophage regulatory protein